MPVLRDVRIVQVAYPQIYFACHTRHIRRASTAARLSAADSTLLAHLDEERPTRPTELARHLGVSASTLSAAINRLAKLGYATLDKASSDRRAVDLRLTAKGAAAMQASSVLDAALVEKMLARLSPSERKRALDGIGLLAKGARLAQGNRQ